MRTITALLGSLAAILPAPALLVLALTGPPATASAQDAPDQRAKDERRFVWIPVRGPETKIRNGDLNRDGVLDAQDITEMMSLITAQPGRLSEDDRARADLDADGDLDADDVALLLQAMAATAASPPRSSCTGHWCCYILGGGSCCGVDDTCSTSTPGEGGGLEPPDGGGGPGGIGGGGGGPPWTGPGGGGIEPPGGWPPPPDPCENDFTVLFAYTKDPKNPHAPAPDVPLYGVNWLDLRVERPNGVEIAVDWFLKEGDEYPDEPNAENSTTFRAQPQMPGVYEVKIQWQVAPPGGGEPIECHKETVIIIFGARPQRVSFEQNHRIFDDFFENSEFDAPHWLDADDDGAITPPQPGTVAPNAIGLDRNFPIAYTRNQTVVIKNFLPAIFTDQQVQPPDVVYYRAYGPNGVKFYGGRTDVNAPIPGSKALPEEVKNDSTYILHWKISFDGQHAWFPIGVTEHRMYVTASTPSANSGQLQSYYHIATTGSDGALTLGSARNLLLSHFRTRFVTNARQDALYYYRHGRCDSTAEVAAPGLVTTANGQCPAWTELLAQALRIHGIEDDDLLVLDIHPANLPRDVCGGTSSPMLWINNVTFGSTVSPPPCTEYPYRINVCSGIRIPPPTDWPSGDVDATHGSGVEGQGPGNFTPNNVFGRHIVLGLRVNAEWNIHDPSYGTGPFATLIAWQNNSVAGFAFHLGSGHFAARPKSNQLLQVRTLQGFE